MDKLEELKRLLSYNPETGQFTWLVKRLSHAGKAKAGSIAGTLKTGVGGGYIQIGCFQVIHRAHRLAYLFMTGEPVPKGFEIDHINGNRADNRWENLRVVTRKQNSMNHGKRSDNSSGSRGVYWLTQKKKWLAKIVIDSKPIYLGIYSSIEDATNARRAGEEKYCGDFRRKPSANAQQESS